jgi:hypothetical protein
MQRFVLCLVFLVLFVCLSLVACLVVCLCLVLRSLLVINLCHLFVLGNLSLCFFRAPTPCTAPTPYTAPPPHTATPTAASECMYYIPRLGVFSTTMAPFGPVSRWIWSSAISCLACGDLSGGPPVRSVESRLAYCSEWEKMNGRKGSCCPSIPPPTGQQQHTPCGNMDNGRHRHKRRPGERRTGAEDTAHGARRSAVGLLAVAVTATRNRNHNPASG